MASVMVRVCTLVLLRRVAARRLAAALLLFVAAPGWAQPSTSKEYQLKAVFLFRFAQFVTWPADSTPESLPAFVIGVLGDDPFGLYLDDLLRNEQVRHRPCTVERYHRVEDITACHVLFVSPSAGERMTDIASRLRGRGVLTVGDTDGFSQSGGMIRFDTASGKIRLMVNLEAVKAEQLTISSKLLRSVDIVTPRRD